MPLTLRSSCATCQRAFEVRRKDHRFCSAKCRLASFHHKQLRERRERDAKVRLLLGEALNLLSDGDVKNGW
jgi:hypothetical protein